MSGRTQRIPVFTTFTLLFLHMSLPLESLSTSPGTYLLSSMSHVTHNEAETVHSRWLDPVLSLHFQLVWMANFDEISDLNVIEFSLYTFIC